MSVTQTGKCQNSTQLSVSTNTYPISTQLCYLHTHMPYANTTVYQPKYILHIN